MLQQAREFKGSIDKNAKSLRIDILGLSSIGVQISGTFVGTLEFEGSVDGTNWVAIPLYIPEDSAIAADTATTGLWIGSCAGLRFFRVISSAWTSGTANVSITAALSGGGAGAGGGGSFVTPDGDSMVDETNDALKVVLATALSNLIDQISAHDTTNSVMNGTTALTPKFAKIVASSSGATQVVAAVSLKKIRVIGVVLLANAAVNVKFQSHTTPTDLTGLAYFGDKGGFAPGYIPKGHFETLVGEALDINLSGAVAVGGWLIYLEV